MSQPEAARKATTKAAAGAAASPQTWPHLCGAFLAAVTTSLPRPWARLLLAGVQVAERSWAAIVSSLQAQQPAGSAVRTRDLQRGASLLAVCVAGPCQARCARDELRHPLSALQSLPSRTAVPPSVSRPEEQRSCGHVCRPATAAAAVAAPPRNPHWSAQRTARWVACYQ